MKNKVQLSIPSPCGEDFNSFVPTALGGFCGSCRKDVIDFTTWDEEQIKAYFKNRPLNTCGRFRPEQLKTYDYQQSLPLPGWIPAMLMGVLVLLTTRSTLAQTRLNVNSLTEQRDQPQSIIGDTVMVRLPRIIVSGEVRGAEDSVGIPGVNILRKGTSEGVTSDAEGRFEIEINSPSSREALVFSFIGYQTSEQTINVSEQFSIINPTLTLDVMALGETVVVGGVVRTRWYSPRTWWWKVRGLFNRY